METPVSQIGHLVDAREAEERWILHRPPIGSGGQGRTYRANRRLDAVEACVKVLNDQSSDDRRRRFFEEANALATIAHSRVPRLIETNATADRITPGRGAAQLYLASELVAGETLAQWVDGGRLIPVRDAIEMALRILEALHELHPTRVHRDLKPENIILRNGNVLDPVLLDFGLSASGDEGPNTPLDQELGNRFLRLPEMAPGSARKRDAVTDVTFVAALLLFALTGERPSFLIDETGCLPHQRGSAQRIIGRAPDVDSMGLLSVFDRAFQHPIEKRFGSAAELAAALRGAIGKRERRGTSQEYLLSLWAPSGEVTPEQAEEFAALDKRVLSWVQGVLYSLRPLPEWIHATMVAGPCPEHRSRTAVCQQMGFQADLTTDGQQRTMHVLPHFIAEVVGHDVVLRGQYAGFEAPLLRSPAGQFEPTAEDRSSVERFLTDCLRRALTEDSAHPLRLEFGDGPGFADIDPNAGQARRQVVSFALINDGNDFIPDCTVRFRSIIPPPSNSVFAPGALLRDGIDMPAGQCRFVKLACYDDKFPTGFVSQKIGLFTPNNNALGGGFGSLVLNEETRSYEIVLEVLAPGLHAVQERIILSVDDKGQLRLESL